MIIRSCFGCVSVEKHANQDPDVSRSAEAPSRSGLVAETHSPGAPSLLWANEGSLHPLRPQHTEHTARSTLCEDATQTAFLKAGRLIQQIAAIGGEGLPPVQGLARALTVIAVECAAVYATVHVLPKDITKGALLVASVGVPDTRLQRDSRRLVPLTAGSSLHAVAHGWMDSGGSDSGSGGGGGGRYIACSSNSGGRPPTTDWAELMPELGLDRMIALPVLPNHRHAPGANGGLVVTLGFKDADARQQNLATLPMILKLVAASWSIALRDQACGQYLDMLQGLHDTRQLDEAVRSVLQGLRSVLGGGRDVWYRLALTDSTKSNAIMFDDVQSGSTLCHDVFSLKMAVMKLCVTKRQQVLIPDVAKLVQQGGVSPADLAEYRRPAGPASVLTFPLKARDVAVFGAVFCMSSVVTDFADVAPRLREVADLVAPHLHHHLSTRLLQELQALDGLPVTSPVDCAPSNLPTNIAPARPAPVSSSGQDRWSLQPGQDSPPDTVTGALLDSQLAAALVGGSQPSGRPPGGQSPRRAVTERDTDKLSLLIAARRSGSCNMGGSSGRAAAEAASWSAPGGGVAADRGEGGGTSGTGGIQRDSSPTLAAGVIESLLFAAQRSGSCNITGADGGAPSVEAGQVAAAALHHAATATAGGAAATAAAAAAAGSSTSLAVAANVEKLLRRRGRTVTVFDKGSTLAMLSVSSLLGSGGFAKVYLGTWRGLPVAVKVTLVRRDEGQRDEGERDAGGRDEGKRDTSSSLLQKSAKEIAILSTLSHPNVVQAHQCMVDVPLYELVSGPFASATQRGLLVGHADDCMRVDETHVCHIQVMEYCDRGSLAHVLKTGSLLSAVTQSAGPPFGPQDTHAFGTAFLGDQRDSSADLSSQRDGGGDNWRDGLPYETCQDAMSSSQQIASPTSSSSRRDSVFDRNSQRDSQRDGSPSVRWPREGGAVLQVNSRRDSRRDSQRDSQRSSPTAAIALQRVGPFAPKAQHSDSPPVASRQSSGGAAPATKLHHQVHSPKSGSQRDGVHKSTGLREGLHTSSGQGPTSPMRNSQRDKSPMSKGQRGSRRDSNLQLSGQRTAAPPSPLQLSSQRDGPADLAQAGQQDGFSGPTQHDIPQDSPSAFAQPDIQQYSAFGSPQPHLKQDSISPNRPDVQQDSAFGSPQHHFQQDSPSPNQPAVQQDSASGAGQSDVQPDVQRDSLSSPGRPDVLHDSLSGVCQSDVWLDNLAGPSQIDVQQDTTIDVRQSSPQTDSSSGLNQARPSDNTLSSVSQSNEHVEQRDCAGQPSTQRDNPVPLSIQRDSRGHPVGQRDSPPILKLQRDGSLRLGSSQQRDGPVMTYGQRYSSLTSSQRNSPTARSQQGGSLRLGSSQRDSPAVVPRDAGSSSSFRLGSGSQRDSPSGSRIERDGLGSQRDSPDSATLLGTLKQQGVGGSGRRSISEASRVRVVLLTLIEIAGALAYMHRMGVVHCDLKPANILLRSSGSDMRGFCIKVCDFGLSRVQEGDLDASFPFNSCGTPAYVAPEALITDKLVDSSVDVYAYGIMMWELYLQKRPYGRVKHRELVHDVVVHGLRPVFPPHTPQEFSALAKACWVTKKELRPKFDEVLSRLHGMYSKL